MTLHSKVKTELSRCIIDKQLQQVDYRQMQASNNFWGPFDNSYIYLSETGLITENSIACNISANLKVINHMYT